MERKREVWQRGPVENIPGLLQPVAHALLQAREELSDITARFPENMLWQQPGGVASPAFHIQHLTGVLDRLFSYARQQPLTSQQLHALSQEGNEAACKLDLASLTGLFDKQVDACLQELSTTDPVTLTDKREIGREKLPTTLIGLYVHAAEHTMRHIGQLLVTTRILKN